MLDQLKSNHPILWVFLVLSAAGAVFFLGFILTITAIITLQTPLGSLLTQVINWLFAMNSVQSMWYFTRSAGIVAYLLLWFSTVWGLLIPTRLIDKILPRGYTFDFHQFISLLAIGFIVLHVGVLMLDKYLPFTLAQILFPFISPYRPVWVGIGVLAFYLTLLVTITFYLRSRIGMKAFKSIHLLSLLSFAGAALHGLMAGTDSALPATRWMYLGTFLVVVFLTSYYLILRSSSPEDKTVEAKKLAPVPVQRSKL